MAKRRGHGEGSISQRHDHPSCPPLEVVGYDDDGEPIKDRPVHACRGHWVAQVDLGYINGQRKRRVIYGATRKEVAIKLQEAMSAKASGSLAIGQVTVETWLNYWLDTICAERGLKINTMKSHRSKVKQYLIPHLGRHRLERLTPEHVRAMYAAMRKQGLSEATLRQTHAILRRALQVAVRERKAPFNVADMIDPPKTTKKKRTGLTLAEARKVLAIADVRWFLALYLGMRQGEVLGLCWSRVNLEQGWLYVERTLVRNSDDRDGIPPGLVFDRPKSVASRRYVPLPTVVLSRLKVAYAEWLNNRPAPARIYSVEDREWLDVDDLVFSASGRPVDHHDDWEAWVELLGNAGVPRIPLHAARNTAASLLEAAGASDREVAEIIGHASVQITHNYQAAEIERQRQTMAALEAYVTAED